MGIKNSIVKRVKENIRSELEKNSEKTLKMVIIAVKEVVREDYSNQIKKAVEDQLNGKK